MNLEKLEGAVQDLISRGSEAALEALKCKEATTKEFAWAAGTLAGRLDMGPTAPEDPTKPWV